MKIVFIGDSITDCDRNRDDITSLGNGYVRSLSNKLHPIYPDKEIALINNGKAGNEVCDLLDNLEKDCLNYKPDMVVLMIGINNTWHQFTEQKQLDLAKFERDFRALLTKLKENVGTVIFLEPFLLPAPDKMRMRHVFESELKIINDIGYEICDEFVALDEMLNGLSESTPYTWYAPDGIHPTYDCSLLIADQAIKAIRKHLI